MEHTAPFRPGLLTPVHPRVKQQQRQLTLASSFLFHRRFEREVTVTLGVSSSFFPHFPPTGFNLLSFEKNSLFFFARQGSTPVVDRLNVAFGWKDKGTIRSPSSPQHSHLQHLEQENIRTAFILPFVYSRSLRLAPTVITIF